MEEKQILNEILNLVKENNKEIVVAIRKLHEEIQTVKTELHEEIQNTNLQTNYEIAEVIRGLAATMEKNQRKNIENSMKSHENKTIEGVKAFTKVLVS